MGNVENTPFAALGSALRAMRLRSKESILEASAAVEVTGERLARFENGELRPSEDVLELLIAHYNIPEKEADKLWDLAGYKKEESIDTPTQPQTILMAAFDPRIVYSDMVNAVVNDYGVVLTFLQTNGNNSQPLAISRIGMSKDHAKSIIKMLTTTLEQAEGKGQKRLQSSNDEQSTN